MAAAGSPFAIWEREHSEEVGDQRTRWQRDHFTFSAQIEPGVWLTECACGWGAINDTAGEAFANGGSHIKEEQCKNASR